MMNVFRKWFDLYLADEQAIILLLLLAGSLLLVVTMGNILAPFFASLIIAYLLQGLVAKLEKQGMGHLLAVILVYVLFLGMFTTVILVLFPLVWQQLTTFVGELPGIFERGQKAFMLLPEKYPGIVSADQLESLMDQVTKEMAGIGQNLVSVSVSSLSNVITLVVYLIVVPIMVFFLLKDKESLIEAFSGMLPRRRAVLEQVWQEMDDQIANYVRGKVVEIIMVAGMSIVSFQLLGLDYAVLLGLLVGLSVIIPYIGAAVVTLPVLAVGYFQWGPTGSFWWLFVIYSIIQALDGNVLVPLLFSEAVNLHPIAIIMSVLVFGGIWGFWGVFFAIPLATLIKAVMRAWPTSETNEAQES